MARRRLRINEEKVRVMEREQPWHETLNQRAGVNEDRIESETS